MYYMSIKVPITETEELRPLIEVLEDLRRDNVVLIALLFGSYAEGKIHPRSDIDIAIYLSPVSMDEEIEIIDRILMSVERQINILRLDNENESPFVVQEALKGVHLVEPDREVFYKVSDRALHEAESIRFRRGTGG